MKYKITIECEHIIEMDEEMMISQMTQNERHGVMWNKLVKETNAYGHLEELRKINDGASHVKKMTLWTGSILKRVKSGRWKNWNWNINSHKDNKGYSSTLHPRQYSIVE